MSKTINRDLFFITAHFRFPRDYGGQRSRFLHEAALSSETFANVTTVCPDVDSLSGDKIDTFYNKYGYSIKYIRTNRFYRGKLLYLRFFSQFIFSIRALIFLCAKNSTFVLNNNPVVSYIILGLFFRLFGRRYILDVRDFPLHVVYHRFPILSSPIRFIDALVINGRYGSISVSNGLKVALDLNGKNDHFIPLGFDDDQFLVPKATVKPFFSADLCYVGSVNTYFNLLDFLYFLQKNNFQGTFNYFGSSDVSKLVGFPFFKDLGSFKKSDLSIILQDMDYGLFPTGNFPYTQYLLGNKFYDYLYSSCYLISFGSIQSDVSCEIAKNNLGIVVDSEDYSLSNFISSKRNIFSYHRAKIDFDLILFFRAL